MISTVGRKSQRIERSEDMGKKLGKFVVKNKILILIVSVLLLIPSAIGYIHTKVNYDILTYLPDTIETMKGQDILKEEFGTGAFSMYIVEGMPDKDVQKLEDQIKEVPGVKNVIWYSDVMDISIPKEMLPDDIYEAFNNGDATMMFILFDDTTSADETIEAVREIRKLSNEQCFVSGMSAVLVDTQDLAESEAPIYVMLAVLLCCISLMLSMDSYLVPFLFLASIGMAIVYNLGTNQILGSISYITKALAAVLQLGVTMDYSIFLWHSYEAELEKGNERNDAMVKAIDETLSSILGSSITTIAGFIALCFMSFRLGMDLGLVMSKGVLFGVISCVTILPALILVFDKALNKTRHKAVLPDLKGIGKHVTKHAYKYMVIALVLLIPAVYGYVHIPVYYNLGGTLPKTLDSSIANEKLETLFDENATHILMVPADESAKDIKKMSSEMEDVDGVKWVLGLDTVKGSAIPDDMIPDDLKSSLKSENWQMMLIGSKYAVATDEVNNQVTELTAIAKKYNSNSMLIGEAAATKDLISVTDHDFNWVSSVSIGIIFLIIAFVFRSASLPFILIATIYLGITINMAVPFFTGREVPFIANIVIGTIQLGSTVDYAILMTTRYRRDRTRGVEKQKAVEDAVQASAKSILVSAMSFFAATFGVGMYSNIDVIRSLCSLMARGAIIHMGCVIFVLPSLLLTFDKLITKTSKPQRG